MSTITSHTEPRAATIERLRAVIADCRDDSLAAIARIRREAIAAERKASQWRVRELVRAAKLARPAKAIAAIITEAEFIRATCEEIGQAVRIVAAGRAGR